MSEPTPNESVGAAGRPGHPSGSAKASRPNSIFISHESSDCGLAQEIRAHLQAGGFDCWMAPDDIDGSTPWPEQIAQAIDACDVMLVVVSANANGSPHVSREVDIAVETGKPLLPVRVEDIVPTGALNYLLRLAQWIDVFPGTIADHAGSLTGMATAMAERQPGAEATPFAPTTPYSSAGPPSRNPKRKQTAIIVAAAAVAFVAIIAVIALLASRGDSTVSQIANTGGTADAAPATVQPTDQDAEQEAGATVEPSSEQQATVQSAAPAVTEPRDDQAPAATVAPGATGASVSPDSFTTGPFTLVSVATNGTLANGESTNPALSADGRFVVFDSVASNLVDGDSGAFRDVFVHDRETGETSRVSEIDGQEADGDSRDPWISADGRYVLFVSTATDLDPEVEDTNGTTDVFLHDRESSTTQLVSRTPDGSQHSLHSIEAHMSDDATLIAYATFRDETLPLSGEPISAIFTSWVFDGTSGTTTRLAEFTFSDPNTAVCTRYGPRVSPDGSLAVVSCSAAFFFDRATGAVTQIMSGHGSHTPTPAPDGNTIYLSADANADESGAERERAHQLFGYELSSGEYERLSEIEAGWLLDLMSISSSGSHLSVVVADVNMPNDILVVDTADGTTLSFKDRFGIFPNTGPPHEHGGARLSGDGGLAAFSYHLDDLVEADSNGQTDIFVLDLTG